jgi:hypothetical protein
MAVTVKYGLILYASICAIVREITEYKLANITIRELTSRIGIGCIDSTIDNNESPKNPIFPTPTITNNTIY